MKIPKTIFCSMVMFCGIFILSPIYAQAAATKLPPAIIKGKGIIDLPPPFDVLATALNKTVTLNWQWTQPESIPIFTDFGYEVRRGDGKTWIVPTTTFSDFDLDFGSYSYIVRTRGGSREKGKRVDHVSVWSEPVMAVLHVACTGPPSVSLSVHTTQSIYSNIPSLRLHLQGATVVPEGCTLKQVTYHLDTGTGIEHSGLIKTDASGNFDTFVNAIGPEDEIPEGSATFAVTATAEDEAGPTTSDAYSIVVQLRNPYAPQ